MDGKTRRGLQMADHLLCWQEDLLESMQKGASSLQEEEESVQKHSGEELGELSKEISGWLDEIYPDLETAERTGAGRSETILM